MSDLIRMSDISDILRGHSIDTEEDVQHVAEIVHKRISRIQAEQIVHAEWTEEEQCSNCGHDAEFTEWTTERRTINGDGDLVNIEYEVKRTYHLTKRCPHCGARMDAKEEANANE